VINHVQAYFIVAVESMSAADRRLADEQVAQLVESATRTGRELIGRLRRGGRRARHDRAVGRIPAPRRPDP
jgi:hypothetical protein